MVYLVSVTGSFLALHLYLMHRRVKLLERSMAATADILERLARK